MGIGKLVGVLVSALGKLYSVKHFIQISIVDDVNVSNAFCDNFEQTRRERLKSAPYLRLKKRKTFFLEKIEIFEIFFLSKKVA